MSRRRRSNEPANRFSRKPPLRGGLLAVGVLSGILGTGRIPFVAYAPDLHRRGRDTAYAIPPAQIRTGGCDPRFASIWSIGVHSCRTYQMENPQNKSVYFDAMPKNLSPEKRKQPRLVKKSDGSWLVEKASGERQVVIERQERKVDCRGDHNKNLQGGSMRAVKDKVWNQVARCHSELRGSRD